MLPILHLNGYKISNPTVLARIGDEELGQFLRGCGWEPLFVEGDVLQVVEVHQGRLGGVVIGQLQVAGLGGEKERDHVHLSRRHVAQELAQHQGVLGVHRAAQDGVWGGTIGEERRAMREPSRWRAGGLSAGAVNPAAAAGLRAMAAPAAGQRARPAGTC